MENFTETLSSAIEKYKLRQANTHILIWTACSEEMPPENGDYLITVCDNINGFDEFYIDCDEYNKDANEFYGYAKDLYAKVIAWAQLPLPYKKKLDEPN